MDKEECGGEGGGEGRGGGVLPPHKDEMSVGSATDCSDNCQELRVNALGTRRYTLAVQTIVGSYVSNFGA